MGLRCVSDLELHFSLTDTTDMTCNGNGIYESLESLSEKLCTIVPVYITCSNDNYGINVPKYIDYDPGTLNVGAKEWSWRWVDSEGKYVHNTVFSITNKNPNN